MWIIIVFVVFIGILCVVQWSEDDKRDAEKAMAEARKQARREQIASSPNVAIIAQAIISRWGFPEKIEIDCYGVSIRNLGKYESISYANLGIERIYNSDCSTLSAALCSHPLLEDKYKRRWSCETSDRDEENWLELKIPVASKTLQEW